MLLWVINTVAFLDFPNGTQDYYGFMESRCAVWAACQA